MGIICAYVTATIISTTLYTVSIAKPHYFTVMCVVQVKKQHFNFIAYTCNCYHTHAGVIAFLMAALISRWCYYHQKEKGNIKGTCDDSINHSSPLLHGDDNIINYHTEH